MNREKDILVIESLATFENQVKKVQKPFEMDIMVMPGTLEDKYKNIDPEKGVQALRRRFNLVFLVLDGEQELHIGAEHRWVRSNDLVIVPENMVYSSNHIKKCQGYYIRFKTEFVLTLINGPITSQFPFLDAEADHIINLSKDDSKLIQKTFKDIIQEYNRMSIEKDFLLKNYLLILLLRIREIYFPETIHRRINASYSTKLANRFKHLVEKNFVEIREVKQYADILNISPGHLSDTVKKTFGKSAREIINTVLLLEAKVLLGSTDQSISEIAHYLRFEDQAHFNHFIKHHTGYSPKELRKIL